MRGEPGASFLPCFPTVVAAIPFYATSALRVNVRRPLFRHTFANSQNALDTG
jgi:hypothetical protein